MAKAEVCAYCGALDSNLEREHAIPACLYPESKSRSKVQRIVVPACAVCNRGWSDDEAHFRSVLTLAAGEAPVSKELWGGPIMRSFREVDAGRRLRDLYEQMKPVDMPEGPRFKIYPGRDPRVVRVVRKVVRGLAHFHEVDTAIDDDRVWADIMPFEIPTELLTGVTLMHREPEVLEYWFEAYSDGDIRSVWYLRFLQKVVFVAAIQAAIGSPG